MYKFCINKRYVATYFCSIANRKCTPPGKANVHIGVHVPQGTAALDHAWRH